MVIDYLNRIESLDITSLPRQEREAIIMTLGYLEKRERSPELSREIRNQLQKIKKAQPGNAPQYQVTYKSK